MKNLTAFWARITGKGSSQLDERAANSGGLPLITDAFVKTFNRCPICDQDFLDHHLALLSVISASKGEAVTALVDKVKNHQWAAAREINEFEPSQDTIEIYVLRCPGSRLAIAIVEDPFELDYNPSIIDYEVLDDIESQDLRTVLGETKWWSIK